MAYIKRPQAGERVLQSLYDSVNSIIDYLPTLTVRGDNYSTSVEHTGAGTIIHAKKNVSPDQAGGGKEYLAGSGLALSGNVFSNALSGDNTNIEIIDNVITYIGSGGGGGEEPGGPDNNTTYTGEGNQYSSGWIYVSGTPLPNTDTYVIYSNLRWIKQLYNDQSFYSPSGSSISIREDRLSTASLPAEHFVQTQDLVGNRGINTKITSGSYIPNVGTNSWISYYDEQTGQTVWVKLYHWSGIAVDCVLTGGRFIEVNSHWMNSGGQTPEEQQPDDHTINSLLSGDGQHIFISQQTPNANGSWGGIISTNIHGDESTISMAADGTLSVIGGGGGGGSTGGCPWPKWQNLAGSANVVWTGVEYTTSTGGWLRISQKGYGTCHAVYINGNYIGLGAGPDTWPLAIPPNNTFYIDFPSGDTGNTMCWFDSDCTPAKVTTGLIEYWRYGIADDTIEVTNALDSSKSYLNTTRTNYNNCKDEYSQMSADWFNYLNHMFDPQPQEPADVWSYRNWRDSVTGYNDYVQEYGTSALTYATSALTKNNSMGSWSSDLMATKASGYITSANTYMTDAAGFQTSALQIWGYAEAYWQEHDPDYQPESD